MICKVLECGREWERCGQLQKHECFRRRNRATQVTRSGWQGWWCIPNSDSYSCVRDGEEGAKGQRGNAKSYSTVIKCLTWVPSDFSSSIQKVVFETAILNFG